MKKSQIKIAIGIADEFAGRYFFQFTRPNPGNFPMGIDCVKRWPALCMKG
jgi:hypothetical protein